MHASIALVTGVGSTWCSVDANNAIRLLVEGTTTTTAHSLLVSCLHCRFGQIDDVLSRWTMDHNKYDDDNGLSSRRRSAVLVSFDKDSVELTKAKARLKARWDTTTPSAAGDDGINGDLDARDGRRQRRLLSPLFKAQASLARDVMARLLSSSSSPLSSRRPFAFKSQECSNICWALAKLQLAPPGNGEGDALPVGRVTRSLSTSFVLPPKKRKRSDNQHEVEGRRSEETVGDGGLRPNKTANSTGKLSP